MSVRVSCSYATAIRQHHIQCPYEMITYPRSLVSAAGDEIRAVGRELEVGDDIHMRTLVVLDLLAGLCIEERNFS